jgi:hypothetical protein
MLVRSFSAQLCGGSFGRALRIRCGHVYRCDARISVADYRNDLLLPSTAFSGLAPARFAQAVSNVFSRQAGHSHLIIQTGRHVLNPRLKNLRGHAHRATLLHVSVAPFVQLCYTFLAGRLVSDDPQLQRQDDRSGLWRPAAETVPG